MSKTADRYAHKEVEITRFIWLSLPVHAVA